MWGNFDRPGELFSGAGCGHIKQISIDGWGAGSGRTSFGAGFGNIKQINTNGGGAWPGPGEIVLQTQSPNINEG